AVEPGGEVLGGGAAGDIPVVATGLVGRLAHQRALLAVAALDPEALPDQHPPQPPPLSPPGRPLTPGPLPPPPPHPPPPPPPPAPARRPPAAPRPAGRLPCRPCRGGRSSCSIPASPRAFGVRCS